jgi:hypothetical protein
MTTTYTFPMTAEQWDAADLSYYTLCRIMDTQGIAIYSYTKSYERLTGTLTVDRLGNFMAADLKWAR